MQGNGFHSSASSTTPRQPACLRAIEPASLLHRYAKDYSTSPAHIVPKNKTAPTIYAIASRNAAFFIRANTCPRLRATAALRRAWRGGAGQGCVEPYLASKHDRT